MNKNYTFFMSTDLSNYVGKWIAIENNKIIAEANDPKTVIDKARQISKNRPFIAKVPEKSAMIF